MRKVFTVTSVWDPDADVFITVSDIPDLVVEAGTFKELVDLVRSLAPEVIAANVLDAQAPYTVQIVTTRELAVAWMARDYYDDIIAIPSRAGWTKTIGGKGSHGKWIDADEKRVVIVPPSKSRHTANEVLTLAGLPKAF